MRVFVAYSFAKDQDLYVHFACEHGSASARWGESAPPEPGEYDVEIELHGAFRYGHDLRSSQAVTPVFQEESGRVRLVGKVDSIEEDGLIYLRLGPSLISVEVADGVEVSVGDAVEVTTSSSSVELFPYDL